MTRKTTVCFIAASVITTLLASDAGASTPVAGEYLYAGSIAPTFIANWGAYDWVVFCRLFGRLIDLPKHFPMFIVDLQQEALRVGYSTEEMGPRNDHSHDALGDALHNRALHIDMQRFENTVLG